MTQAWKKTANRESLCKLQGNFVIWREINKEVIRNVRKFGHTGGKFGQSGGKFYLACREINIFSRPDTDIHCCK